MKGFSTSSFFVVCLNCTFLPLIKDRMSLSLSLSLPAPFGMATTYVPDFLLDGDLWGRGSHISWLSGERVGGSHTNGTQNRDISTEATRVCVENQTRAADTGVQTENLGKEGRKKERENDTSVHRNTGLTRK